MAPYLAETRESTGKRLGVNMLGALVGFQFQPLAHV